MEIGTTLYVKDRRQWRAWLARHHKTAPEIWLIYYKKHSGRPRIPYSDAVEEALCYGWIDSITKPVDEDRWAQRFTPRRPSRSEEHTSELQSQSNLVCRLLLEKKKNYITCDEPMAHIAGTRLCHCLCV